MTERAQILEIKGVIAKVQCVEDAGCTSCSSSFCTVSTRTFQAAITSEVSVKTGDQVEIYLPPSRAIGSGFLVLIFPLILFVAVYLAFGFLENEGAQVGAGLGGLIAGFAIVYLIGRGRPMDLPRIVRVFSAPELIPAQVPDTSE